MDMTMDQSSCLVALQSRCKPVWRRTLFGLLLVCLLMAPLSAPERPVFAQSDTTHTVQPGESLYGIGAAYGVSASAMLAANPWVYSRPNYYVYPGDSVCIP